MKTSFYIRLSSVRLAVADLMDYGDGTFTITRINVPSGFRGKGYGRELLRQVLEAADFEDIPLRLEINPYGDLDYDQLKEWYERHGFEEQPDGSFLRQPGVEAEI